MLQINIFYKSLMNFGLKRIFWRLLGVFKKFLNGQKISKRHWTPHLMKNQIEIFQELIDLSTKSSKRHPTKVIFKSLSTHWCRRTQKCPFLVFRSKFERVPFKNLFISYFVDFFFKYLIKGGAAKTLSMSEILSSER